MPKFIPMEAKPGSAHGGRPADVNDGWVPPV